MSPPLLRRLSLKKKLFKLPVSIQSSKLLSKFNDLNSTNLPNRCYGFIIIQWTTTKFCKRWRYSFTSWLIRLSLFSGVYSENQSKLRFKFKSTFQKSNFQLILQLFHITKTDFWGQLPLQVFLSLLLGIGDAPRNHWRYLWWIIK